MRIDTIVVPIAFSPHCAWAVRYGAMMAGRLHASLICLHVGDEVNGELKSFVRAAAPDIAYRALTCPGDPADVIVEVSGNLTEPLIVMPTRSCGRFRRLLVGSVTAKVLHDAECPVITSVHEKDLAGVGYVRRILCGVDYDDFEPVVSRAKAMAAALGAEVRFVHAIPAVDEKSDNRGERAVREYLHRVSEERFEQLRRATGLHVPIYATGGPVTGTLRDQALEYGADLLVIGRRRAQKALGGLRTHVFGIVQCSPCPVMSV